MSTIQWIDDRAVIDTLIWKNSEDECVDRQYFNSLYEARLYARKINIQVAIHDGHKWHEVQP